MNMHEEMLLYDYLKTIQRLSHSPIVYQDPVSQSFMVKSGGTKQGVYAHMVDIRNIIDFILKLFFEEKEVFNGVE